jgi:hypothetical protein
MLECRIFSHVVCLTLYVIMLSVSMQSVPFFFYDDRIFIVLLIITLLSVVLLNVIMLRVVILSVVKLIGVMLSVVLPL